MSILEQKGVKRSNFGQSKIACHGMDSSCRNMRRLQSNSKDQHAAAWQCLIAFLFLATRVKSTPFIILLCSYKKEVIDTFCIYLAIYFLLNLSRLLREFVRRSLGTWKWSTEDLFHQFNLAFYSISSPSISFYSMISNTSMMNFIKNTSS